MFGESQYTIALTNTLIGLVENHGVRIMHTHYAIPHAVCAHLARSIVGTGAFCSIVSLHGTDVITFGGHPAYQRVVRAAVQQADVITVPSVALRLEATHVFALDNHPHIAVQPNFVDTEIYQPLAPHTEKLDGFFPHSAHGLSTLIHVSNFRPVKRVNDVIACFEKAAPHLPVRLLMVGDGPERAAAEAHCRASPFCERIRFLGNRPRISEHLPHCAALLLPSEYESFGLAALEALSCGVPVIATHIGGLPEVVVEGTTGFLVPVGDTNAMADAVRRLLTETKLHASMAAAARTDALERFGLEVGLNRWEKLYHRISTWS
ncbi:MAG: N-acetyl-alpha-D-glucosaminyl L-malate synthase BshA [Myxococcota bacterium]